MNDDECGMRFTYKRIILKKGEEIQGKKGVCAYKFEDDRNIFHIRYYKSLGLEPGGYAIVEKVECKLNKDGKKENEQCKDFIYTQIQVKYDKMVSAAWNPTHIEIEYVYLGNAAKQKPGICTRTVSYLLKVLLLESKRVKQFPYIGKVHISSKFPCAAGNCYSHAFQNNGFRPDPKEMEDFIKKKASSLGLFDFKFKNFISTVQILKQKRLLRNKIKESQLEENKTFYTKRLDYITQLEKDARKRPRLNVQPQLKF